MQPVIEVQGLRKTFGQAVALDGLDLRVDAGQVHGFLGPNGAGKSTTLRILLGLLRSDGGTLSVLGKDPWCDAAELHRQLAYVPGDVSLWPNLTGGEVIDLLGKLRGRGVDTVTRARLIEAFKLDPAKKCRSYSKGNRQKVALIAALAADVPLLLLDEPTSGLDPLMEQAFTAELRRLQAGGTTVLLSSHILSEVEAVADHVSIVRDGRVVETGRLDELRGLSVTAVTATLGRLPEMAELSGWPGVHDASCDGSTEEHRVHLSVDTSSVGEVVARLNQFGVRALTCSPPTLEQLFLSEYTQR